MRISSTLINVALCFVLLTLDGQWRTTTSSDVLMVEAIKKCRPTSNASNSGTAASQSHMNSGSQGGAQTGQSSTQNSQSNAQGSQSNSQGSQSNTQGSQSNSQNSQSNAQNSQSNTNQSASSSQTNSGSTTASQPAASSSGTTSGSGKDLKAGQNVSGTASGAVGAVNPTVNNAGPNGSEDWMNTGLTSSGGWQPPMLLIDNLVYISIEDFYNGVGQNCRQYADTIATGAAYANVPETLVAAIAMQESSCNANAQSYTPGLMQVAQQNYNSGVDAHTATLAQNMEAAMNVLMWGLKSNGNSIVGALGNYNGWYTGITKSYIDAQPDGARQNADYMHQILNGWLLGIEGYTIGEYHNV